MAIISPLSNSPLHISLFLFTLLCIVSAKPRWSPPMTIRESFETRLHNDNQSITEASIDYGYMVHEIPNSVLDPWSVDDIIDLILNTTNGTVAARGHGHSLKGQDMARGGVVVNMSALSKSGPRIKVVANSSLGPYADVGGEQLWIDVLNETIKYGLAPVSWTDYLYLSVGGTLSNAGISGQAFLQGPQINNVLQLDVVTGDGKYFVNCSRTSNPKLFYSVLGGLGQFGIITQAKIKLDKAPTKVKWAVLMYRNFSTFTRDQRYLISSNSIANYVEGFLIVNENTTNILWSSSFSIPLPLVAALLKNQSIIYTIELAKYYYTDNQISSNDDDQDFQKLVNELHFIPGYNFSTDVSLFNFLHRVGNLDILQEKSPMSHPWLNLFVPSSSIADFNDKVLAPMLPTLKNKADIYILYPMNQAKWDVNMCAVIPSEHVFYSLGLLHSTLPKQYQIIDLFNNELLHRCEDAGINVIQYLPQYTTQAEWEKHYGSKWKSIVEQKKMFDSKNKLSPGQRIFGF